MEEMKMQQMTDEELDTVAGGARVTGKTVLYTVRRGDNLTKIAKRYRTSIQAIMDRNPIIKDKNFIKTGWKLTVPDNR